MLVQKLRLQKGWSQQQLADLSGLSVRWASPSFPDTFNDMMCSGDINDEDKKELHGRVQT